MISDALFGSLFSCRSSFSLSTTIVRSLTDLLYDSTRPRCVSLRNSFQSAVKNPKNGQRWILALNLLFSTSSHSTIQRLPSVVCCVPHLADSQQNHRLALALCPPSVSFFVLGQASNLIRRFACSAHPIDSVVPLPKSSSTTIASVSARSTYSVTIHGRTVHSRTEFPNAYPPMDVSSTPKRSNSPRRRSKSVPITPRDKSRLLALRQDPSVASLLNHYDDQGHLSSTIFSNTPSPLKQGRVQRRHTGSTLRQLLGHPSFPDLRNGNAESDISWAEKYLGSASNTFLLPKY